MFEKSKDQKRVDKTFQKMVADMGRASLRADAPELPHNNPAEQGKITSWQRTEGDADAEALSELAWRAHGLEPDVDEIKEPAHPSIPVQGTGRPKYVHTPGDVQAQFATEVHEDLSKL
ncbi:MAG TPA: hypothetical protein V6C72_05675 [Chroococcales cyanobacterium]